MTRHATRSVLTAAITALLVTACGTPQGSPAGSSSPTPSPPVASATGTPASPSASTSTPVPTPTPQPAFDWGTPHQTDLGTDLYAPSFVHSALGFVLADETSLWQSTDARHWTQADSSTQGDEDITIEDIAARDDLFVAVGSESTLDASGEASDSNAVVLTSIDGQHWDRVTDPRFDHAEAHLVAMSAQGVVVFGVSTSGPVIWTSPDGHDWLKATNETGREVANGVSRIVDVDGALTAFVSVPGATEGDIARVDVWQTQGRAEWTKVGELPGSDSAQITTAAYGGGHWIAVGSTDKDPSLPDPWWSSTDAMHWTLGSEPQIAMDAIIGLDGGFVGIGYAGDAPGTACGSGDPYVGLSWTSSDGSTWIPLTQTPGAAILAMAQSGDRLVGLGHTVDDQGATTVEWEATLPKALTAPAPSVAPTSTPAATPSLGNGCGP
jgi:hypothetical protein